MFPPCFCDCIHSSFTLFCDHRFQFKTCLLIPVMLPSATMFVSTYLSLAPPFFLVPFWNLTILFLSLVLFFSLLIFLHSRSGRLPRYHGQLLLEPGKELPCHLLATFGSAHRTWMKIIVLLMTQDRKHPQAHTYVSKTGTAEQQGACNLKSQLR